MMAKVALITGVTGQDGSFLADYCSPRIIQYMASSAGRQPSTLTGLTILTHTCRTRTSSLRYGDLSDGASLRRIIESAAG